MLFGYPQLSCDTSSVKIVLLWSTRGTLTAHRIAKLANARQYQVSFLIHHLEGDDRRNKSQELQGIPDKSGETPDQISLAELCAGRYCRGSKEYDTHCIITTYAESLVNYYLFPVRMKSINSQLHSATAPLDGRLVGLLCSQ